MASGLDHLFTDTDSEYSCQAKKQEFFPIHDQQTKSRQQQQPRIKVI
jgi:hypothetical protein